MYVCVCVQEFVNLQAFYQTQIEDRLAGFHDEVLASVTEACEADLQCLEERLKVSAYHGSVPSDLHLCMCAPY